MRTDPKFLAMAALSGLAVLAGLIAIISGLRNVLRALASKRWPQVHGQITEVKSVFTNDVYSPEIRYEYVVNGHAFTGNTITIGDFCSSSPSYTKRVLARYPLDSTVLVSFNPEQPQDSVLEPGQYSRALFSICLGGCFVLFSALMFWAVTQSKP